MTTLLSTEVIWEILTLAKLYYFSFIKGEHKTSHPPVSKQNETEKHKL